MSLWLLRLIAVLVIVFGSLYPFNFDDALFWTREFHADFLPDSRSDALANFMLFVPAGALAVEGRDGRIYWPQSVLLLFVTVLIAVGLQIAQLGLPTRVPSAGDALMNVAGTGVGFISCAVFLVRNRFGADWGGADLVSLLLLLGFFGYVLSPFAFTADFGLIKDNIKYFIFSAKDQFDLGSLARGMVLSLTMGMAVISATRAMHRGVGKRAGLIVLLFLGAMASRFLVSDSHLLAAGFIGGLAGIFLALSLMTHWRVLSGVGALGLCLLVTIHGLTPFELRPEPARLSLVPLEGFLGGQMGTAVNSLLFKFYVYSGLVFTLAHMMRSWRNGTAFAMAILAAIEAAQTMVNSGNPEITDPLMACGLGFVFWNYDQSRGSRKRFEDERVIAAQ